MLSSLFIATAAFAAGWIVSAAFGADFPKFREYVKSKFKRNSTAQD